MAEPAGIVAEHYLLEPAAPAPRVGGVRSYVAHDRRDPGRILLAIPCSMNTPPRERYFSLSPGASAANTVLPIDIGPGRDPLGGAPALFVVFPGLPAQNILSLGRRLTETELINNVLMPVAMALEQLDNLGLTHRAVRPDNLFIADQSAPCMLGPGFLAPPAMHQGVAFEPPYSAWCRPYARGTGQVADDVYALGVTLLALYLNLTPMAGLDDAEIVRRKIELGSFEALTAGYTLPPLLNDLLRGMLAEDPEHRPTPMMLQSPEVARGRRVAARPPRRAARPLEVGGRMAWSARDLAYLLGIAPEAGAAAIKNGQIDRWIRRGLGDSQLAIRLVENIAAVSHDVSDDSRANAVLIMRAVVVLDPLAPIVWRHIVVAPDGLGSALASGKDGELIAEIVTNDITATYATCAPRRQSRGMTLVDAMEWRGALSQRGLSGGLARLNYTLNAMIPCTSPLVANVVITKLADLPQALEVISASTDRTKPPIDAPLAAFIAARGDAGAQNDAGAIINGTSVADHLAILHLFARLQTRYHPGPLPGLAGWLLASVTGATKNWQSRSRREMIEGELASFA